MALFYTITERQILESCRAETGDMAADPAVTASAVMGRIMQGQYRWWREDLSPVCLDYLVGHGILHRRIAVRTDPKRVAAALWLGSGGTGHIAHTVCDELGVYVVTDAGSRTRIKRAVSRCIEAVRTKQV